MPPNPSRSSAARINGVDVTRSLAIMLAMLSHTLIQFDVFEGVARPDRHLHPLRDPDRAGDLHLPVRRDARDRLCAALRCGRGRGGYPAALDAGAAMLPALCADGDRAACLGRSVAGLYDPLPPDAGRDALCGYPEVLRPGPPSPRPCSCGCGSATGSARCSSLRWRCPPPIRCWPSCRSRRCSSGATTSRSPRASSMAAPARRAARRCCTGSRWSRRA